VSAIVVDQSGPHLVVSGADRVRFVNGMCMGNVAAIPPGGFLRTAMLSPKGRVLAVFDIAPRGDTLVLLMEAAEVERARAILDRHAIADDVAFEVAPLAVHRLWDGPASVWEAPPVFAPPPAPAASAEEVEVRRIEAGLPRFGVDVSEDNFPFETPLARLIDYKKGCYIGQEPIARVAARGSASKQLRGLLITGGDGAAPVGAVVAVGDRPIAGKVTSAVISPRLGPIALAYLPRGADDAGQGATVDGRPATVVLLPFA
jgi:folate-binding protein YgfZ